MSRCYLIQDPYHPYAASFIDVIYRTWGHRAVCLYTNGKHRFYEEDGFPILRSERVAASFELEGQSLTELASRLGRYDIAGVVPFSEPTVATAAALAERLQLNFCTPATLRLFRDKFALKDSLRRTHPELRLNASRRVESASDVLFTGTLPSRYVIKPNDGFGNAAIGMFDAHTSYQTLDAFFARQPARSWVLEEFIDGTEYFVNGQVGARGELAVVAVFQYERAPANGRENLDHLTWKVAKRSPEFAALEHYAREVVKATGLTRSPFHLEAKIDERGPCLIEIGARLVGNGNAYVCGSLHGAGFDLFEVAAHHYLNDAQYGPLRLDWDAYDATELVYVHGVASEHTVIESLEGIDEIERLPEFASWVRKPALGGEVLPTDGLLTSPYCVLLRGRSRTQLREASLRVRALLRWSGVTSIAALRRGFGQKLQKRLSWELIGRPLAQLRRLTG